MCRWTDALNRQFRNQPLTYEEIIEAIDHRMIDAATDAELARRGGGIAYIGATLRLGPLKSSATEHERRNEHGGGQT